MGEPATYPYRWLVFLITKRTNKGKQMAFDLSDYQTVQERIEIFWKITDGNGRIINELVKFDDRNVIVKCSVWKDKNQELPDAVDYAQEFFTEKGINATSALENCTSSATGRALSLLAGELSPSKKRASRTEMEKMARSRDWAAELEKVTTREQALALYNEAKNLGVNFKIIEMIQREGKRLAEKGNALIGKEISD